MSRRVLTAALAFVAVTVGIVTVVLARDTKPAVDREQLLLYQAEVVPPLNDGGRVVQQSMKPAVERLRAGTVQAAEVDGWVTELKAIRDEFVLVEEPDGLRDADTLFRSALDKYIEAAESFRSAVTDAPNREAHVEFGLAVARSADRTYDDASRIIQEWRRRLGLAPAPEFPDPTPTSQ